MKLLRNILLGISLILASPANAGESVWVTTDFDFLGHEPQVLTFDASWHRSLLADFTGGYRRDQVIYNHINDTVITLGGSYAVRRDMNYFSRTGERLSYTFDLTGVPAWIHDAMIVKNKFVVGWAGSGSENEVVFSSALNNPEDRLKTLDLNSILPDGGFIVSMFCVRNCVFLFDYAGGVIMINFDADSPSERGPFYFNKPEFAGIQWASCDGQILWIVKDLTLETWNMSTMFPDTWTLSKDLSDQVPSAAFYVYSTLDGHTIVYSFDRIDGFVDENHTGFINLNGADVHRSKPIVINHHNILIARKYGENNRLEVYEWPSSIGGDIPVDVINIENPIVGLFTDFNPRRPH